MITDTDGRTQRINEPGRFLTALEDFPEARASDTVKSLLSLWDNEMRRVINTNTPKVRLWSCRVFTSYQGAAEFTEEFTKDL